MKCIRELAAATAVALGVALIGTSNVQAADVVVTPSSLGPWGIYKTNSSGIINTGSATAEFVNGPATPPLGTGSAHFKTAPGLGNESGQMRYTVGAAGLALSALTELKYSTYVTTYNGSQAPYLTLWVDTNGDTTREGRLWFEPTYSSAGAGNGNPSPQPAVTTGSWQSWDALGGMWYAEDFAIGATPGSGAKTWSYILANLPGTARLIDDSGQGIGGLRIASGFASAGNNFDTNVDSFTIGTALGSTTYDFELNAVVVPLPAGGWAGLSLLAVLGGMKLVRNRFQLA